MSHRTTHLRRLLAVVASIVVVSVSLIAAWAPPLVIAQSPAPAAAAARSGAAHPAPDWLAPLRPGQLLVRLTAFSPANAQRIAAESGMSVRGTIPQLGIALFEAEPAAASDLAPTASALMARSDVEWAEPNYTFSLDLTPNDPFFASNQATSMNRMEMPAAWEFTTGISSTVIAVLDTGIDFSHPDLKDGIWTNPREIAGNGIDDDGNGFIDDIHGWDFAYNDKSPADDHGHGTHVAGIAAARIDNGIGIAGMAGGATIMPVKVFFSPPNALGTYEDLIRAIIYATDNGAHVINMSLGASSYSRGEEMAVDYAWERGVVVFAAAGNTGRNTYHYPGAHANVIAVAATDANDNRAGFSTYGDFIDVAAPGSGVFSTYIGGGYGGMSGTSMASPHVAGLAALLFSRNPQLTNAQVRELIEGSADDLGTGGFDLYFGHGRINGRRALAAVAPSPSPSPAPQPSPTPTPHPSPTPFPPLTEWPAGCVDLITDGDFEAGAGAWQTSGSAGVDATHAYSGTQALHFTGGSNASGVATRTLTLAANAIPTGATLWFAYRIETSDGGWGTTPQLPFDDRLDADIRSQTGARLVSLLRTGNTADTASSGLPWDRYVYRMLAADFALFPGLGPIALVFTFNNDSDTAATSAWIDAVRFCVAAPGVPPSTPSPMPQHRYYLPLWFNDATIP